MKFLKITATVLGLVSAIACKGHNPKTDMALPATQIETVAPPAHVAPATIQIALLLDTSNSMDGLIDQAKTQLWDIVNKMSGAHCYDQQAQLEIALYEYGNSTIAEQEGYVRKVLNFSTDLDLLSKQLFDLRTQGGDEYCGLTIHKSLQSLEWRKGKNDLKIIFIAGNESFNQGPQPFSAAVAQAVEKDVVVNTIFCGDWQTGVSLRWKEAAALGKGEYLNIDHNARSTYVTTPYDDAILRKNKKLNNTYIAYGYKGAEYKQRQLEMDEEVQSVSAQANVKRTLAKSSSNYRNSNWDLVDALEDEDQAGNVLNEESLKSLPDSLQGKSKKEIIAFAKAKKEERIAIQKQIQELNRKREQYIASQSQTESNGLESAMFQAIKKQSASKNYRWK